MEKIEERKLPILDEDGLLDMIRTSKAQPLSAQQKQKIKELERVPTVKPTSPRVRSPVMQAPEAAVAAKRGTSTAKKRLDMDESKQREAYDICRLAAVASPHGISLSRFPSSPNPLSASRKGIAIPSSVVLTHAERATQACIVALVRQVPPGHFK